MMGVPSEEVRTYLTCGLSACRKGESRKGVEGLGRVTNACQSGQLRSPHAGPFLLGDDRSAMEWYKGGVSSPQHDWRGLDHCA